MYLNELCRVAVLKAPFIYVRAMLVKVKSDSQTQKYSQVRKREIHGGVVGSGRRNLWCCDSPQTESANSVVCVCVFRVVQ